MTDEMERLAHATAEAENWMSKAPYLCYDLAKELIVAANEVCAICKKYFEQKGANA